MRLVIFLLLSLLNFGMKILSKNNLKKIMTTNTQNLYAMIIIVQIITVNFRKNKLSFLKVAPFSITGTFMRYKQQSRFLDNLRLVVINENTSVKHTF